MESDEIFERMTVAELRIFAKARAIFNRALAALDAQDKGTASPM